jgi:methylenetetrahydrofolate reductase (NADPH)
MVLEELWLTPEKSGSPLSRPLPWRPSLGLNRRDETVRPIFWRNRNTSYVARTADWDEFPNGRWGDSRSPAFGGLDAYGIGLKGTNEANVKLWGQPTSLREITDLFVRFINGELSRLPWSEGGISAEAESIKGELIALNQRGLLTINSQPAIDGMPSSHPVHGWGPVGGYVYQKAYLELLVFPSLIDTVLERIESNKDLTYYAVNKNGTLRTNTPDEGPNAVTWGIFPNREIVQPTIVETVSFLAWKDEAFRLGEDWSRCYPADSGSRQLIEEVMNQCWLVNIVNNDFHQCHPIFKVFEGLAAEDFDKVFTGQKLNKNDGLANGDTNGHVTESEKCQLTQNETPQKLPIQPTSKVGEKVLEN